MKTLKKLLLYGRNLLIRLFLNCIEILQTRHADPSDIHFCYRLLLLRKPDLIGLTYWKSKIRSGMTYEQLTTRFFESDEFKKHRALTNSTPIEIDGFKYM